MARLLNGPSHDRATHRSRKAGARRAVGVAGRPLKLSRAAEKETLRHAVRRRPPLRERLAARVKQQTKRLEPPRDTSPSALLAGAVRNIREAILPNDPRDAERREQSGEPVVALVGAVDLVMLLALAVLLVIGMVMVYSASLALSYTQTSNGASGSTNYYAIRQAEWLLLGLMGMYVAMRMDYRRWRKLAGLGLVVSAGLLLLLHTARFGVEINGSRRWVQLTSFFTMEPSEFAKMGLVLYAAHWFAGQRPALRHSLRGLLPFGAVVGALVALVFKEPDLGTTAVIVAALFMVYFVAGARLWHLGLMAFVGFAGFEYYVRHMPAYQMTRWLAFLDPNAQAQSSGYHYLQVRYALGTGGLTGVGLGNSQAKFSIFMPHTDSIFAILGEEWGVIGTLGIMLVFLIFGLRGIRASILAPDMFGRLLAMGLTGTIVFQALLNMAVVATVVPFTGIPLPFISYGGSSLSISMVAAGILLNISKQAIDIKEERDSASTYLWWRNRRPHLPGPGRHGTALPRAALGQQPTAASIRRSTGR